MTRIPFISVTKKDCDMETFKVSGAGGQHRDKTDAGVRWRHRASGATGQAVESRSQEANKRAAWRRMANSVKFRLWLRDQGKPSIEEVVSRQMHPSNLKVEVMTEDGWAEQ